MLFPFKGDASATPAAAAAAFAAFIRRFSPADRLVCLHDSDADGVCAGVVWQRAIERSGFVDFKRLAVDRLRNAWSAPSRTRLAEAAPAGLFVLDLGSRSEALAPGVPTCLIDHHRPEGTPPDAVLICAYRWDPIPNTSLMVWELCQPLCDMADLDWVAAVGTVSDLGEQAPFAFLTAARKRYTSKYLREAAALVNAARRASHYNPEAAARALLTHPNPKSFVLSTDPDLEALRAARAEVNSEMERARRVAPIFSGNIALLRLHSPCQIHPLIAQSWRNRLPRHIVIAANDGYLPDLVNFAARTASGINLLDFFASIDLPPGEGSYGKGHDQASGGVLPVERWQLLLEKLGFRGTSA